MRVVVIAKMEKKLKISFLKHREKQRKAEFFTTSKKRAMYLSEIHLSFSFFLFSLLLFVKLKTLFHKERSAL
ncbi:MAG: hypothetical protein PHO32_09005 [Candidatus Cloacimonetes bacterium]|nr:hypothetical protein [Candidatus Cloacimonadota bacterium]